MIKKIIILLTPLIISPFILVYIGNIDPPAVDQERLTEAEIKEQSHFFHKDQIGVHNVVLTGDAFKRGQQFGFWTKEYLLKQESTLVKKLDEFVPYSILRSSLFLFSMGWFYGVEKYFQENWRQEMFGVSLYGSQENLFFATPYTRQMAYHGVHDMGQMMIDRDLVLGACTQVASPQNQGWLIGRNFDFEAGRVFDEDKLLKWVFPEDGEAFVSILFSGMVGVITGINQHGVYVAINAAGSDDFTRLGTPTTLIALKAIQNSKSAKEAVEIIRTSEPLITDIFVVADSSDTLYIVEKTPERFQVIEKKTATAITNHLQHPEWENDKTNTERMTNNTTVARYERAQELLSQGLNEPAILNILRDKFSIDGKPAFVHRSSIDAMIASHSILYNSEKGHLYVSKGPSLSQAYIGFDLKASFAQRKPVTINNLPADPDLENLDFYELKNQVKKLTKSRRFASSGQCKEAQASLNEVHKESFQSHYAYHWSTAELLLCLKQKDEAREKFQIALKFKPAYLREIKAINEKIKSIQ